MTTELKCVCGYELPFVPEVWTKPKASAMDVEVFGVIMICPKCQQSMLYEVRVSHHIIDGQIVDTKKVEAKG